MDAIVYLKNIITKEEISNMTPIMAKMRPSLKFSARMPAVRGNIIRASDPEAANQPYDSRKKGYKWTD